MGANESRSQGPGSQASAEVEDYYTLLGVEEDASGDDIKVFCV
jgi:hypothetical protein